MIHYMSILFDFVVVTASSQCSETVVSIAAQLYYCLQRRIGCGAEIGSGDVAPRDCQTQLQSVCAAKGFQQTILRDELDDWKAQCGRYYRALRDSVGRFFFEGGIPTG